MAPSKPLLDHFIPLTLDCSHPGHSYLDVRMAIRSGYSLSPWQFLTRACTDMGSLSLEDSSRNNCSHPIACFMLFLFQFSSILLPIIKVPLSPLIYIFFIVPPSFFSSPFIHITKHIHVKPLKDPQSMKSDELLP